MGLILFTEEVEKFIPPKKGRRHALRVIREILLFEPAKGGTDFQEAIDVLGRLAHRQAIVVVISDFLFEQRPSPASGAFPSRGEKLLSSTLGARSLPALRQANRRHDVIAIQVVDRFEMDLPEVGRLVLTDAETGELVEINTRNARFRSAFAEQRSRQQTELMRALRGADIDVIEVRTDQPYAAALGHFFETREKRRLHV